MAFKVKATVVAFLGIPKNIPATSSTTSARRSSTMVRDSLEGSVLPCLIPR